MMSMGSKKPNKKLQRIAQRSTLLIVRLSCVVAGVATANMIAR